MSEVNIAKLTPDIDKAKAAIEAVERLDLRSADAKEILDLLTPVFYGLERTVPRFYPGLNLFRVRLCDKPLHIRDISYPPSHQVQDFGRANMPGKPMFYCCSSRQSPLYEARPKVGQTGVITKWVTTAPLLVNHVGYTQRNLDRPRPDWAAKSATINPFIQDFLERVFTRIVHPEEKYLYKLSATISEKLCGSYDSDIPNGLQYPSIPMNAKGDNFALKPRFVDSNLRFAKAEFIRIDAVNDSTFDIKILDTATKLSVDGSIVWKGRLDRWVLRNMGNQLTFTAENGEWVARNMNGYVIDPE